MTSNLAADEIRSHGVELRKEAASQAQLQQTRQMGMLAVLLPPFLFLRHCVVLASDSAALSALVSANDRLLKDFHHSIVPVQCVAQMVEENSSKRKFLVCSSAYAFIVVVFLSLLPVLWWRTSWRWREVEEKRQRSLSFTVCGATAEGTLQTQVVEIQFANVVARSLCLEQRTYFPYISYFFLCTFQLKK